MESLLEPPVGTNPTGTVISAFWPPGLWQNRFLLFEATPVCGNLLW